MDFYAYDDFRVLLADLYSRRKESTPRYSYRTFAAEADFSNPGYLNDVVKGRRKLSSIALEKVEKVFAMTPKESEYFRLLVKFGQSKSAGEREESYRQILFRRSRSSFARVNAAQSRYYQDYRYPLVRSAIEVVDFRGDYEKLSRFLVPAIPVSQVRKCVRDLCKWGLVQQQQDGRYFVSEKFVEPSPHLGELIRQLNRTWIEHGRESIRNFSPEDRHVSTILLNISPEAEKAIRKKIDSFRSEIFDILKSDENPDRIMQLSLQYFPKSVQKES